MLMGMGLLGWIISLVLGYVIGGVFFLTMKLEVEYVVQQKGPTWLVPAALYARMVFVAAVLVLVAVLVPGDKVAAAMLGGVIGTFASRVCVHCMVRRQKPEDGANAGDG